MKRELWNFDPCTWTQRVSYFTWLSNPPTIFLHHRFELKNWKNIYKFLFFFFWNERRKRIRKLLQNFTPKKKDKKTDQLLCRNFVLGMTNGYSYKLQMLCPDNRSQVTGRSLFLCWSDKTYAVVDRWEATK